jgi:hypothetical protein
MEVSRLKGIDVEALFDHMYSLEEALFPDHQIGEVHKRKAIELLRRIEASLDPIELPKDVSGFVLVDPDRVHNYPVVVPPRTGPKTLSKERFPENEVLRSTRPADLRRLRSRFDAKGSDPFIEMDVRLVLEIGRLIEGGRYSELRVVLMENAGSYMSSIRMNDLTGLYILELGYRMREVMGLDEPELDGLLGLMVPGSKVLAASEGRDHIIPDDLKLATLVFVPGYRMRTSEDARRIIDSVQTPSPMIGEFKPEFMLSR